MMPATLIKGPARQSSNITPSACAAPLHGTWPTSPTFSWRVAFVASQQPPSILLSFALCSSVWAETFAEVMGAPAPAANGSKVAVRLGHLMAGVGRLLPVTSLLPVSTHWSRTRA